MNKIAEKSKSGLVGKKRKRKPEETDSDSDYEQMSLIQQSHKLAKKSPSGKGEGSGPQTPSKRRKTYLEEYLTFGELAGLVPQSLLVNVNFERFASANGFEPLDQASTLKSDKK